MGGHVVLKLGFEFVYCSVGGLGGEAYCCDVIYGSGGIALGNAYYTAILSECVRGEVYTFCAVGDELFYGGCVCVKE